MRMIAHVFKISAILLAMLCVQNDAYAQQKQVDIGSEYFDDISLPIVTDYFEETQDEDEDDKSEAVTEATACKNQKCDAGYECVPRFSCGPLNAYCKMFGVWSASCIEKMKSTDKAKSVASTTINPNTEKPKPNFQHDNDELCKNVKCGPGLICVHRFSCAPMKSDFCQQRGKWVAECGVDGGDEMRCTYPVDPGNCRALMPSWYYNAKSKKCEPFDYGGCDGNGNRFKHQEDCKSICEKKDIKQTVEY